MNRTARRSRITLIFLFTALLWPRGFASAQTPSPSPTPAASPSASPSATPAASPSSSPKPTASPQPTLAPPDPTDASEKVKLYYMRQATNINKMLTEIGTSSTLLNGLVVKNSTEDELVLFGSRKKRDNAHRIIAALDLPRPGVIMEMWGIQITSKKPDEMAQAMALIRQEINRTQQAVRNTYRQLETLTVKYIPDVSSSDPGKPGVNEPFRKVLEDDLFYHSALRLDHQLSLADILLRMTAANNASEALAHIANDLDEWLNTNYSIYVNEMNRQAEKGRNKDEAIKTRTPFERFLTGRGLTREGKQWENGGDIDRRAQIARLAVLDFAYQYGRLIHAPQSFSSYHLQQASEALNTRLQNATDAINLDMQDLFVEPTLERIRKIVRDFKNVEYAQIGKTTVASLSGVQADVTTKAVNNFEVTPPLTLTEVLTKAKTISDNVNGFIPKPADNLVGGMPLSQVIGLIAAFGDDRTVFRELQAGISLSITPNVLRNMTSAELKLDLKIGDPQQTVPPDKVKPLSRVSQHNVNTSIYVDPLDFFDLSAFANQSTLDGGRGYVPIIGPVWRGLFGEIPIAGKIFSWKRGTQNILNQSLVLTNSYITPTSMGIAVLYPTDLIDEKGEPVTYDKKIGDCQWNAVWDYRHKGTITIGKNCLRPDAK